MESNMSCTRPATPSELQTICLTVIAGLVNEGHYEMLLRLSGSNRVRVCERLSFTLPLKQALQLDMASQYWRGRALAHFPGPHIPGRPQSLLPVGEDGPFEVVSAAGSVGGPTSTSCPRIAVEDTTLTATDGVEHAALIPPINALRCDNEGWQQRYLEELISKTLCGGVLQDCDSAKPTRAVYRRRRRGDKEVEESSEGPESRTGSGIEEDMAKLLPPLLEAGTSVIRHLQLPPLSAVTTRDDFDDEWLPFVTSAIHQLPRLKKVCLAFRPRPPQDPFIPPSRIGRLAAALAAGNLTDIRLTQSGLTDQQAALLLPSLASLASLTTLDLSHNLLTSSSAHLLKDCIASGHLHTLVLANNCIDSCGGATLGSDLGPALRCLALNGNPLKTEGVLSVLDGAALPTCNVTLLSLSGCRAGGSQDQDDRVWKGLLNAVTSKLSFINMTANAFLSLPPAPIVGRCSSADCWLVMSSTSSDVLINLPYRCMDTLPVSFSNMLEAFRDDGGDTTRTSQEMGTDYAKDTKKIEQINETRRYDQNYREQSKSYTLHVDLLSKINESHGKLIKPTPPGLPTDLHGMIFTPDDFLLEEDVQSLCLFTKELN